MIRRLCLPAGDLAQHRQPLPRLHPRHAITGKERRDDRDEIAAAGPVVGMFGEIQPGQRRWVHPFALHFLHQRGQTVGQVIGGGARGNGRVGIDQRGDQLGQFQPLAQRGCGYRHIGHQRLLAKAGDSAHPGQQPRAAGGQGCDQPRAHPRGVDQQIDPRQPVGRLARQPVDQTLRHHIREIDTRRQGKQPWAGLGVKHRDPPTSPLPARCFRDGRHRTTGLDTAGHMRDRRRSSDSRSGSAKRPGPG